MKVMLIDDNDTDNYIHRRIIEISGFAKSVLIENSARSALKYLHIHQKSMEDLPDIIFLDITMPEVNGFAFLLEFENFPQTLKDKCKIVILSSSDNVNDINRVENNGNVIKYFTKPLHEEHLELLTNYLAECDSSPSSGSQRKINF